MNKPVNNAQIASSSTAWDCPEVRRGWSGSSTREKSFGTERKRPLALSLFSGAGGMDLGVSQAGFDIVASVEIDPHCCETLRAWRDHEHRRTKVIEADIRALDPLIVMSDLELIPGKLDLLFGGPPCQAFSQIGKRASLQDERGMLLFQVARFAEVFRPQTIIVEQVKGLLNAPDEKGRPGGVFDIFLNQLRDLGYVHKWQVMNAADYGVPQLRQRLFTVGILSPNDFRFPVVTHARSVKTISLFPLPAYVTVGEALEGLGSPGGQSDPLIEENHRDITPMGDRRRIHGVPEGSYLAAQHHLPLEQRCNLTKKDTTKFRRLSRGEPALTLRCGEIFFHPTEDRYLTPREYMRLHGYPDDFCLKGPIRGRSGRVRSLDQHRQVANSVPPPLARIIAQEIVRTLECQRSLKSLVIQ